MRDPGSKFTDLERIRDGLCSDDPYTFSNALYPVLRQAVAEQLVSFGGACRVDELARQEKDARPWQS